MKETERIADQLTRSIEGNAWHGPSLMELLEGVNAKKAASKKIEDAHSIWEIVNHVIVWMDVVAKRVGNEIVNITPEEDWANVNEFSEQAWQKTIENLKRSYANLKNTILNFPAEKLDENINGITQTYYYIMQGVIQHNLYHAGQIAILKK